MQLRKLTFEEAWSSITIFFVDNVLEDEIDSEVSTLLKLAEEYGLKGSDQLSISSLMKLIRDQERGLELVLKEIDLSEEKFLRIVSVLRQIGRVNAPLEQEWTLRQVIQRLRSDEQFAKVIADLFVNGERDRELQAFIPRYYLETLNLPQILASPIAARKVRYKRSLIGTYSGRKGYRVEGLIREKIASLKAPFEQGRSRFVNVNIDFAIPSLENPWVIMMCSFQETTSSGQSTKARDMEMVFQDLNRSNSRNNERRVFVNFADGGGWLARKRDYRRLVENCHYFINLKHLDLLDSIITAHVPRSFLSR